MSVRFEITSINPHALPEPAAVVGKDAVFDLSRVEFIRPRDAVALAARVASFSEQGINVSVEAPSEGGAASYASRLLIPQMLERVGGSSTGFPRVTGRNLPDRILELQQFECSSDLDLLAEQIGVHVTDDAVALKLQACLFEIGQNVYQHSGQTRGYVAAQYYPRERTYRFAIADAGRGLRASLDENYAPSDDSAAIDLAVEKGMTSASGVDRGLGLDSVRRLVTAERGWMSVTSGDTAKTFRHPVRRPRSHTSTARVPGTILECAMFSIHESRRKGA